MSNIGTNISNEARHSGQRCHSAIIFITVIDTDNMSCTIKAVQQVAKNIITLIFSGVQI